MFFRFNDKSNSSRQRGFTLIELLVVIAIIGILASIILASLNTARAKGRDAKRVSDIKQIQLALELYYDANGQYPATIYTNNPLVAGGYLSSMPYDPSASSPCTTDGVTGCYQYVPLCANPGLGCTITSYHLATVLETANSALANDSDACPYSSGIGKPCPSGVGVQDAQKSGSVSDFNGLDASANSASTLCTGPVGTPYPGTETCYAVTP